MRKILLTVVIFLLFVNLVHGVLYQKDFTSLSDLLVKLEAYPADEIIDLYYVYNEQLPDLWNETAGSVNWGGGFFDVILDFFQFLGGLIVFIVEFILWLMQALIAPFIWILQNFYVVRDFVMYIFDPYYVPS